MAHPEAMLPRVDVREHASDMLEQHLRPTLVGRRCRPAISTVPAMRSPSSIDVTPKPRVLMEIGSLQLDVGRRQHRVVAALGLERHPDAERVQQFPRPRTRRDHDLARQCASLCSSSPYSRRLRPGMIFIARSATISPPASTSSSPERAHETVRVDGEAVARDQHARDRFAGEIPGNICRRSSAVERLGPDALSLAQGAVRAPHPAFRLRSPRRGPDRSGG